MSDPEVRSPDDLVGQFGLTAISGAVGWWIGLGEFLVGDGSRFSHAFVVVDGGQVVEAMPGGAILTDLAYYLDGPKADVTVFSDLELTDEQRAAIVKEARALGPDLVTGRPGVGYSLLDYVAIALDHWGLRPRWLRKYIADTGHLICSQLCDLVMQRAGIQLFAYRDPGLVTPGDLNRCLYEDIPVSTERTLTMSKIRKAIVGGFAAALAAVGQALATGDVKAVNWGVVVAAAVAGFVAVWSTPNDVPPISGS